MSEKIFGILLVMLLIGTTFSTLGLATNMNNLDHIDQYQTNESGHGWSILPLQWIAQEFTPTLEILTRVELNLFKAGDPDENIELTVSIRKVLEENDLISIRCGSPSITF